MAATSGSMALTSRSFLVPKTLARMASIMKRFSLGGRSGEPPLNFILAQRAHGPILEDGGEAAALAQRKNAPKNRDMAAWKGCATGPSNPPESAPGLPAGL